MIKKITENIWEVEKEGKMLVPGIIFASEKLLESIKKDNKTILQIQNVAQLPGIVNKSIALPDAHQGYGFPIGGVAAFDLKKGIISPGGVGYDINCGVRLLLTNISKQDFLKSREKIISDIYKNIPSGLGEGTKTKLSDQEINSILETGLDWAIENGYASKEDKERIEDQGCIKNANSKLISQKAKARGRNQLGTIGSGNHFVEIQEVQEIIDAKTAKSFNLKNDQIVVMIHTGSRGLGHQTASDYIQKMEKEYGFDNLPDRELINAPLSSKLGQEYLSAMAAAANFAFVNRQLITFKIRESFKKFFSKSEIEILYDVCHNIAKIESHVVEGKKVDLCIHRKGATRSFGPGRKEIPKKYQSIGQPIIIPGSMGTFSYVLVGTKEAEELSFASTAHGAGRMLSRSYAIKNISPDSILAELKKKDVIIKAGSKKGIVEEAPEAYKDVTEVVRVSDQLGIGKIVAKLKPLAVIKG